MAVDNPTDNGRILHFDWTVEDPDPDDDPRADHHIWRDNELSGQNAEWDAMEDLS